MRYMPCIIMKTETINAARIEAARAFAEQRHFQAQNASFDALFILAYLELTQTSTRRTYTMQPAEAPQWFRDAVESLPAQPRTAGDFLRATNTRAEKSDCKVAGAWLRQMGFASRKSNGRVYFERSYPPTLPASLPASLAK